ncbi:MAG: PEP-CTERM sorting domain-containing protein [Nitrosospira sp.]
MKTRTMLMRQNTLSSRIRTALGAVALTGGLLSAVPANAAIMFTFDYSDNAPGVGFLDPSNGIARQNALNTAGTLFSGLFSTYFTNSAVLNFAVTSTDDITSTTLASASSNFVAEPGTFGAGEVIRNKLINGTDINGAALDGNVDVNWGDAWELDPNTPAVASGPNPTFDFYAALFHEFTHALGFGSEISGSPASDRFSQGGDGTNTAGSWSKWDQFLTDGNGTSLINPSTYEVDQAAVSDAQSNGGRFAGANAIAAYGSAAPLFADPDQSHLDEATFSVPNAAMNYMMKPLRDYGPQEARNYSGLEVGILTDLGYTRLDVDPNTVPEPSTILLMLAALAGFGLIRRRA